MRTDVVVRGDGFFVVAGFGGGDVVRAVFEGELQDAVVPAAQYGQRAVAGHGADGFAVVVVVAVFFAFVCLVGVALGVQFAFAPEFFAQGADEFGIFRDLFDEDGAGAVQRGFVVGDGIVQVGSGEGFDVGGLFGEEGVGKRLQAVFPRDLCFGAAFGFVGQVEVFERGFVVGGFYRSAQFGAEFALFVNGGEDGFFARFEFAQVVQAFFEGAQLGVVQSTRRFFAVAGDEGHGRAVIEQGDGGGDLRGGGGEFLGEGLGDVHGVPY